MDTATLIPIRGTKTLEQIVQEISDTVTAGGWGEYAIILRGKTKGRLTKDLYRWICDEDGVHSSQIVREDGASVIRFSWEQIPTSVSVTASNGDWVITTEQVS